MPQFTDRIPLPAAEHMNAGLSWARQATMLELLGKPRETFSDQCTDPTNPQITKMIVLSSVGPFRVRGLKPAVNALLLAMQDIQNQYPELYAQLGSAGMLCCRLVRGSKNSISNHSWGTAIDLTINGQLDPMGDGKVQYGMTLLAPIMNSHGFFWGAEFSREDSMHFEASEELLRSWRVKGLV